MQRERERERETETDRQTDRQRERERVRRTMKSGRVANVSGGSCSYSSG